MAAAASTHLSARPAATAACTCGARVVAARHAAPARPLAQLPLAPAAAAAAVVFDRVHARRGSVAGPRAGRRGAVRARASQQDVDVEAAKMMLERDGYRVLDVRSERDYDQQHITKPARCSVGVPFLTRDGSGADARFVPQVTASFGNNKAAKMIVMCADGGQLSDAALAALQSQGFTAAVKMAGGYRGWGEVWSPSGKRRPPPGRWVSTGKEALKSGLNIPGVAESYDEGGNAATARVARGLAEGEALPPMDP